MTDTQTVFQRFKEMIQDHKKPNKPTADRPKQYGKCTYCRRSIEIQKEVFDHAIKNVVQSRAMIGNSDISTRHRKVTEVWPYEGNTMKNLESCESFDSEIKVYSHDWKCYTLSMGIRSTYKKEEHINQCTRLLVEIDIPYKKKELLDLKRTAYQWAYYIMTFLCGSYNKGTTVIDHLDMKTAGYYRVTMMHSTRLKQLPLEKEHERIHEMNNVQTGQQGLPLAVRNARMESTGIDAAAQARINHETKEFPQKEIDGKGKSRASPEQEIEPSQSTEPEDDMYVDSE